MSPASVAPDCGRNCTDPAELAPPVCDVYRSAIRACLCSRGYHRRRELLHQALRSRLARLSGAREVTLLHRMLHAEAVVRKRTDTTCSDMERATWKHAPRDHDQIRHLPAITSQTPAGPAAAAGRFEVPRPTVQLELTGVAADCQFRTAAPRVVRARGRSQHAGGRRDILQLHTPEESISRG